MGNSVRINFNYKFSRNITERKLNLIPLEALSYTPAGMYNFVYCYDDLSLWVGNGSYSWDLLAKGLKLPGDKFSQFSIVQRGLQFEITQLGGGGELVIPDGSISPEKLTEKYLKASGDTCTGRLILKKEKEGSYLEFQDTDGTVLGKFDFTGIFYAYGTPNRAPYASGAYRAYRNGSIRMDMSSLGGGYYIDLYDNFNPQAKVRLYSQGESWFDGGIVRFGKSLIIDMNPLLESLRDGIIERDPETGELWFTNGDSRTQLSNQSGGGSVSLRTQRRSLWESPYCYEGTSLPNVLEDEPKWNISRILVDELGDTETKTLTNVKWSEVLTLNFN